MRFIKTKNLVNELSVQRCEISQHIAIDFYKLGWKKHEIPFRPSGGK